MKYVSRREALAAPAVLQPTPTHYGIAVIRWKEKPRMTKINEIARHLQAINVLLARDGTALYARTRRIDGGDTGTIIGFRYEPLQVPALHLIDGFTTLEPDHLDSDGYDQTVADIRGGTQIHQGGHYEWLTMSLDELYGHGRNHATRRP